MVKPPKVHHAREPRRVSDAPPRWSEMHKMDAGVPRKGVHGVVDYYGQEYPAYLDAWGFHVWRWNGAAWKWCGKRVRETFRDEQGKNWYAQWRQKS